MRWFQVTYPPYHPKFPTNSSSHTNNLHRHFHASLSSPTLTKTYNKITPILTPTSRTIS